jgi:adenine-specific DNA-methyltransferase
MAKQNYNKLELTWIGKGDEPKLEPRILIENPEYSYGDPHSENMLIHGDNLLALKALEQDFTGKIKCIYIDPPYNTGNAFEHYDDGLEHSLWLNLMSSRLKILKTLLSESGLIWITLDDKEVHYCKVIMDEIFGRENFIASIPWKSRDSVSNDLLISPNHNTHLLYSKKFSNIYAQRKKFRLEKDYDGFSNPDNDPNGPYKYTPVDGPGGARKGNPFYSFLGVEGYFRYSKETMQKMYDEGRIVKRGNSIARKYYLLEAEASGGKTPTTWWDDCGTATKAKKEIIELFGRDNIFETPKPENLLEKILKLSTDEGDWVLDSFLGSGTTAAVAHKMGRKWIGVELGEHAKTHCFPRLKAVVDGEQGGVSKAVDWKGGGGFRFYNLAPSLLNEDKYGNWIISKEYNAQMLAAALAKQEGFRFEPDEHIYWKQGKSSEKDFIFTTTQFVTVEMLDKIHEEMQDGESLLITCKSFQEGCTNRHANISIKKIPHMLMDRCEFGKDDYSFNIVNMPVEEYEEETEENTWDHTESMEVKNKKSDDSQAKLF